MKQSKSIIDPKEIAKFFDMELQNIHKHIAKGFRLDLIYIVFNDDKLTTKQKRTYLYHNTSLSLGMKNSLFERYIGDYGYAYAKSGSYSLDFEIHQERGTV